MSPRPRQSRGFTLVEMVITLAIISLLMTLALTSLSGLTHQKELEEPILKLQEFAKKARNLAILEQRPYQVEILPGGIALYSGVTTAAASPMPGEAQAKPQSLVDQFTWEGNMTMNVRRWNMRDFAEPGRHVWIFERSGLCEPLTARIQGENGFIEVSFNALDAHVEDKTSEIQ